jgi:hypothetical protein
MPKQPTTAAEVKPFVKWAGKRLLANPSGRIERRDWARAMAAEEKVRSGELKGVTSYASRQRAYKRLEAKGCGRLWKRFHAVNAAIGDTSASMHPNYPRGPVLKKKYGAKLKRLHAQNDRLRKQLRKSGCV